MTPSDDHQDVSKGSELHDIVTMSMARRTLRALMPDSPPAPSEQLAILLRDGLPAGAAHASRFGRLPGRLAARITSLGIAAKLMLAAGVAVAGAGGAATAVAFNHDAAGHGGHTNSPRNHQVVATASPTPSEHETGQPLPASTSTSIRHEDGSGHDGSGGQPGGDGSSDGGRGSGTSGSQDGSGDSGTGSQGSGDSDSGTGSSGTGSTSDGGSTSGSGDTGGSSDSGSTSGTTSGSGSTSGSDGGSGSTSDGSGDATPSPSSSDG